MKSIKTNIIAFTILIGLVASSCVTNNDDTPPVEPFVSYEKATITEVKDLYAEELKKHWTEREPVEIRYDWSIKGIIIADDKTSNGNFYKEAYVQDESGGLRVTFQSSGGLFVNDSVIINCKGLYLSDYGNFIQLGGDPYFDDGNKYRLTGIDKHKYLKRTFIEGQILHPTVLTINELGEEHMGTLIQLNDVQFEDKELGKTYATPAIGDKPARSENRILEDCNGYDIIVRSSGYSSFAGDLLPEGKGTFVGVLTKFNSDYQMQIRHIKEVQLDGARCN